MRGHPGHRLAKLVSCKPREIEAALLRIGKLAASPSDGKLTNQGKALCEMFNGLRRVWPGPLAAACEKDMLEAIDARDEPRMARALIDFVRWSGEGALLERLDHQRDQRRRGALIAAEHRRRRPSSVGSTLQVWEENTKTRVTKVNDLLADRLGVSASQLRRIIRKRRPQ